MPEVFLSLGSNLGDREYFLCQAEKALLKVVSIIKHSAIYESEPWGFAHPLNFYNTILHVKTDLTAEELLNTCLNIEKNLGRIRKSKKYEARSIDIDIIFYADFIICGERLTIPHPQMHLRKFVLVPLNDVAPEFFHPVLQKTVHQLLLECNDSSIVSKLS